MSAFSEINIHFLSSETGLPIASTLEPRKFVIKSGFGAMSRRCWLELYNEDLFKPINIGTILEIHIRNTRCFRGRIVQRRIDSVDDQLTLYAEWEPEREYSFSISGLYENKTVTEILADVLQDTGLSWIDSVHHDYPLSRLYFVELTLFTVIDLLAKLGGNWIWDVDDDEGVSFHPYPKNPDHILYLPRDLTSINLWETTHDLISRIEVRGGAIKGGVYLKSVEIPAIEPVCETPSTRIYVRPVNTSDAFQALRNAILQQMTTPHYEHYVDIHDSGETIQPGDTVRFLPEGVPLFPQERIFRVSMREIEYAHERLRTRLHLTSGFESTPNYFHYFRDDRKIPELQIPVEAGPFQLDVHALDSPMHLDL